MESAEALEDLLERVRALVTSGELAGIANPTLALFERTLAVRGAAQHAVATVSGTMALELALEAAGVGRGHEVIVPALSAYGTLAAVLRRRATPVIVDVHPKRLTLDPLAIRHGLSEHTRAVIAVHAMGIAPDVGSIRSAVGPSVFVLEDMAQGFPGTVRGDAAALSLSARKPIDLGEGGAVLTNDVDLALALRWLTCLGHAGVSLDGGKVEWNRGHVVVGTSARMPALQAALGLYRLETLRETLQQQKTRLIALRRAAPQAGLEPLVEPVVPLAACFEGPLAPGLAEHLPLLRPASVYQAHKEPPIARKARLTDTPVADRLERTLVVLATDVEDPQALERTVKALVTFA
ncbi:MAG: DegT/DnrJ/EryC1/StrS family aminotransferase [Deltaproteobacteria bacterium]|nr:DegT/DnrJ/EryC1/StrS family aminotransferase [Deltaproteobacteria bacterium]